MYIDNYVCIYIVLKVPTCVSQFKLPPPKASNATHCTWIHMGSTWDPQGACASNALINASSTDFGFASAGAAGAGGSGSVDAVDAVDGRASCPGITVSDCGIGHGASASTLPNPDISYSGTILYYTLLYMFYHFSGLAAPGVRQTKSSQEAHCVTLVLNKIIQSCINIDKTRQTHARRYHRLQNSIHETYPSKVCLHLLHVHLHCVGLRSLDRLLNLDGCIITPP